MQEPPPLIESATWYKRNSKWFVPVICVGAVVVFVGVIALFACGIFGLMKSSDAYKEALARAKAEPVVIEALGSPIREGFLVTGSIRVSGPSGEADLAIPISGARGKATIYVDAQKKLGRWIFRHLIIEIKSTGQRIDISDHEGLPNQSLERTGDPLRGSPVAQFRRWVDETNRWIK